MSVTISPEPFEFEGTTDVAVLMLHGFTGTPVTLRHWGEALNQRGWTVRAPLLPGHGTRWEDLRGIRWQDWYNAAEQALLDLNSDHDRVFVAGLSMGAALSLRLAALHPDRVSGLTIVNPPVLRPDRREITTLLAVDRLGLVSLLSRVTPGVPGFGGDLKHPVTDQQTAYDRLPPSAAVQLVRLTDDLRPRLPQIEAPLLLFTSTEDHVVDPASSAFIMTRVDSSDRTQIDLLNSYHTATLDGDAPEIFERSAAFIDRVTAEPR